MARIADVTSYRIL